MAKIDTVRIYRGLFANLPALLDGELAFTEDTGQLWVGSAGGNVLLTKATTSLLPSADVSVYGAKGDGLTDDTAAINAAITAAAASAAGGGVVYFPPSTAGYLVSSTITIPNNVILQGASRDNSVIKAKAGFTGTFVLATTAINVGIQDLIVHCNSIGNLSGISLSSTGALQATLARLKVIGLAKASPWNNIGIYVKGFNCAISDIEIDGGVIYGVQMNGASDAFVHNILCVNSDIGMAVYGCEQVTIASVQMDSCNTNYLQIDTSHDISVNGFHAFFNATVYSTANNQVGILLGTVGNSYSAPNVNSDIQLSNVTLRNFGQGTAADIGIELVACENLVMSNVSIANSTNSFTSGGTIGVGLKYSQGSNTLSGTLSNLNFHGLTTNESGSAPLSNWTILSDQVASNTTNIAANTANITTNTSGIAAINAAKGAANGFASLDSSGLVPITQMPPAALERLVIVANQTARFALTTATVQNGDTVKQTDTGEFWYIVDQTNLGNSAGYSVYTAGTATSAATATTATKPVAGSAHGAVTLDVSGNFQSVAPGSAGNYIRSNGTDFVASGIQAADVPTLNQNTSGTAANVTGTVTTGHGGTGVTSVTTAPTASSFAGWDASSNLSANNLIDGYATTATAAGTTTLTVSSAGIQNFTGTTTQTVKLPVASTLVNGQSFVISNQSTGAVTVQTSGLNTLATVAANQSATVTCVNSAGGTGTASWNYVLATQSVGGSGTVTSVTFTGDGTVLSSTPSSAVTSSGTVTAALKTQTARTFLQGPLSGAAATPTFAALAVPTVQKFTSTGTTTGYIFTVTAANATAGATYTNNGNTYTVLGTIAGGTTLWCSQASAPTSSGTLTKASGTGDATITFSAAQAAGTYTTPTSPAPLFLRVRMVGGGGGGSGSGTAGSSTGGTGGNTTFGIALLVANGGTGGGFSVGTPTSAAGGTASLGTGPIGIALSGGTGGAGTYGNGAAASGTVPGAPGGNSSLGGASGGAGSAAAANSGSGGGGGNGPGGNVASVQAGNGGGAGGFVDAIITSPAATYSYAVGAAGTAGVLNTSGNAGGAGGSGIIEVTEYYQ